MRKVEKEEIALCKECDLVDLVEAVGFTPMPFGSEKFNLEEMDSLVIFKRSNWKRFSNSTGGDQISFLTTFCSMTFDEAVDYILEFTGYKENTGIVPQSHRIDRSYKPREEKVFRLPPKNDNSNELYRYLQEERGLSKRVINFFIERGLLYESADHDVVFKGYDKNGICKFASRRGTKTIPGEAPRKKDVYGNDKQYGVNIVNDYSREVCVFEAAIDLMSYMDIYDSYKSNKVVLGGTHDAPLETFLVEHPQIDSIRFCMDNDNAGMTAMQEYEEKYQAQGYETMICPVKEEGCKDYNELLQKLRKEEKAKKLAEKRQKAII